MKLRRLAYFAFAFLMSGTAALAQYMPPPLLNVGYVNGQVFGETWEQENFAERAGSGFSALGRDEPASMVDQVSLTYASSEERTRKNLRRFVERTPEAAGRGSLQQLIAKQPNIIREIGEAMRRYGLDPNNVADAYTLWWVNVWSTSQKTNLPPSAAAISAVRRQAANGFVATPDFHETTDAQRQEYAEALMLQAALLSASFDQSKGYAVQLEQLAAAALQGAEATGLKLSKMKLTTEGFVPR